MDVLDSLAISQYFVTSITVTFYGYTGLEYVFMKIIGQNSSHWRDIKPYSCLDKSVTEWFFAVFSDNIYYNTDMPLLPNALPYDLVPGSKTQEIWRFVLILYKMLTDRYVFYIVENRNLSLNNDLSNMVNWSSDKALEIVT